MSETILRQADNTVTIEGLLLEKRLEITKIKTEQGEKEAITGELDIETGEGSTHTVRVFSYKYKQDGSENGIYKGLHTVMTTYKSVASHGREEADKVRITSGQIGLNEYYGEDGQLRSFPQLSANFINRLQLNEEFNPKAEFEVELFVHSVTREYKNDEETGRAILKGYIPLYGGKVIPFEFKVADESAVDYVESNYEPGTTVKVYGDIINHVETKVLKQEVEFGKPKEKVIKTTTREYLITGGSAPYDKENAKAFNPEAIKKALAEREIYLEELKNKKKENKSSSDKNNKPGFGAKPSSNKPKFDPNDLPF